MRYVILLFLLSLFFQRSSSQDWQATNLTNFNFFAIPSSEVHKGKLYALVFNGLSSSFNKYDETNDSWELLPLNGVTGIAAQLFDADSRLYVSTYDIFGNNMLYYSSDEGKSFVPDTVGLDLTGTVRNFIYVNGEIALMSGISMFTKDTSEVSWSKMNDTPYLINTGTDPMIFTGDSVFVYDNPTIYSLYVSGDKGQSWVQRKGNLHENFASDLFTYDKVTGRFYLTGEDLSGNNYGLYYSDNNGLTWTFSTEVQPFIGTNHKGGQQKITAIYAHNNMIYISLENDEANTTPNILSTIDGLGNIAPDTSGLIIDPTGDFFGLEFSETNDYIYLGLNLRDIYKKKKSGSATKLKYLTESNDLHIYPNPSYGLFTVYNTGTVNWYEIIKMNGQVIKRGDLNLGNNSITVLAQGVFILKLWNINGSSEIRRIVVK